MLLPFCLAAWEPHLAPAPQLAAQQQPLWVAQQHPLWVAQQPLWVTLRLCPPSGMQGNPKFLEAVSSWQKKLGTVDVVLNVWNDVQKKWQVGCGSSGRAGREATCWLWI